MRNTTSFILLLLSVALFYTFISPHYDKVRALRIQSAEYKGILANVAELWKKRDDLQVKYNNTPIEEVTRLEKVLPDNVDTVNLAMNFDSIASKYGISIKTIRTVEQLNEASGEIVQGTDGKPYQSVIVTFTFVSTYQNFRRFMEDIEKSLRIIDVKSVSFEAADTGLYDFQVAVQTYWLK